MSTSSRIRSSNISSRRRLSRARELYIDLFRDALNAITNTDQERVKELTDDEADELISSASKIAERGLKQIEERFPGV